MTDDVTHAQAQTGQSPASRILVAEDNPVTQHMVTGVLTRLGYGVDVVDNGKAAIAALAQRSYDLVFMDCEMPAMDGFQATAAIRDPASPVRNHRVPIVALTAHDTEADFQRCLQAGMNDRVGKAITPRSIAAVLEKWLRTQKAVTSWDGAGDRVDQPEDPLGTEAVFDRAGLWGRLMRDEALVTKVTAAFLADMPRQMGALHAAVAQADGGTVGALAHRIKGAGMNVGGRAFGDAAFRLELTAKSGDTAALAHLLAQLEAQLGRLREAMERREDG